MAHLDILYRDADLVIINKPHDLLCVPGLSEPHNLLDLARAHFPSIRTVHRLDMATSGIIVYALNYEAQKQLGRQFENRQVKKQYSAIVHGRVITSSGEISLPLACDWPNRPRQKVDWYAGKKAHTYYEVEEVQQEQSRLRLFPITGRSHQLRVHCLALGHAIVGDRLYDPERQAQRLMLHAARLEVRHPSSGEPLVIHCPPPFTWSDAADTGARAVGD